VYTETQLGVLARLPALGITASVSVTAGTVGVAMAIIVGFICFCTCRCSASARHLQPSPARISYVFC